MGLKQERSVWCTEKQGKPGGDERWAGMWIFFFLPEALGNPLILYEEVARTGCMWTALW